MTPEEYIKAYTRGCSNELIAVESRAGKKVISYHEWLTPENALAAVELARGEVLKRLMNMLDTSIDNKHFFEQLDDYIDELVDELKKE